jgi:hypothetical protein
MSDYTLSTAPRAIPDAALCHTKKSHPKKRLHNIHLAHFVFRPSISLNASDRVPDPPALCADLLVERLQPVASVDSSIGKHDRIVLDDALGVMRIGDIARKLVQLSAADRADGGGGRRRVGRGGSEGRMTCGGLQCGETSR